MAFYRTPVSQFYLTEHPLLPDSSQSDSSSSSQSSPDIVPSSPFSSPAIARKTRRRSSTPIVHPHARTEPKKCIDSGIKRRKVWEHLLEKRIFTKEELSTMKAQDRRKIYISSLEEHIDAVHNQLLGYSLYPVPFERLERMRGINSQTTIAMIAAILRDKEEMQIKLLELERSTQDLCNRLNDD